MPDRIEAGTCAIAAVMTGGEVDVQDAPVDVHGRAHSASCARPAPSIEQGEGVLRVAPGGPIRAVSFQALPYPGLATDLHAPMAALLTQATGVSIIHERVFDNRMLYVGELRKMGAEIVSTGSSAIVSGPTPLHGTRVRALDVRAGAAVLLALWSHRAPPSSTTSTTSTAATNTSTRNCARSASRWSATDGI